MHPRNQFFLYRTHYCCRNDGRASAYLRFLHRSIYRGNVHQPNLEIYQENHYALISGIVVTLIGMSLIKVGITACGGGAAAQADGSFGSLRHVGLAALVLLLIIAFNRSSNRYMRMSSIVIGLVIGYIVAWFMGIVDFTSIQSYGGFNLPMPFRYGLDFSISTIIALGLIFMITAIEAYGDITANSLISGEPVEGETFVKRASGGILADGFNSMLAGMLNSFPNSVFAQNNGMIQLTEWQAVM